MWWGQYALIFIAALIASIGAFTGVGRGIGSLIGTFAWFIWGNASAAVVHYDAAGAEHVATSTPLVWLAYGVAVVHLVVFLLTLHEILTDEEDEDDERSLDDVSESVDPARFAGGEVET